MSVARILRATKLTVPTPRCNLRRRCTGTPRVHGWIKKLRSDPGRHVTERATDAWRRLASLPTATRCDVVSVTSCLLVVHIWWVKVRWKERASGKADILQNVEAIVFRQWLGIFRWLGDDYYLSNVCCVTCENVICIFCSEMTVSNTQVNLWCRLAIKQNK